MRKQMNMFLTRCVVAVGQTVDSFNVDCDRKVVSAFIEFSRNTGFFWEGETRRGWSLEIRESDLGWSVTATAPKNGSEFDIDGRFTATGVMPAEIRDFVREVIIDAGIDPLTCVKGNRVVFADPFREDLEFESHREAKRWARKHRREIQEDARAWNY